MKKLIQLVIVTSLASTMLTSCYYDKKSELAPKITDDIVDITKQISYLNDVVPILKDNCYGCHGNGNNQGGIVLGTYAELTAPKLIDTSNGGLLLPAIKHTVTSESKKMPLGGKLTDNQISVIELWIKQGHKNN